MIEINVSDSQACEADDARNEALALCKQANEIKPSRASAKNQRWLAMQALALDPLCVDAFVILAKCSDDAEALEKQKKFSESITTLKKILQLDKEDILNVRFKLAYSYIRAGQLQKAEEFINESDDEKAAPFAYALLLIHFLKGYERDEWAEELAYKAMSSNPCVSTYLNGAKRPPNIFDDQTLCMNDEKEAYLYTKEYGDLWLACPKALNTLVKIHSKVATSILRERRKIQAAIDALPRTDVKAEKKPKRKKNGQMELEL